MMKVGEGGIDGMNVGRDNVKFTTSNTEVGQYHIESPLTVITRYTEKEKPIKRRSDMIH